MKLYYIFLSMLVWLTCHVYSGECLTADDLTIVLNELSKHEWQDKRWLASVQRHVAELADRIKADETISETAVANLKEQINKAHEKGVSLRPIIRCNPVLLYKIVDHADFIQELRSSKEKHVTFAGDEG